MVKRFVFLVVKWVIYINVLNFCFGTLDMLSYGVIGFICGAVIFGVSTWYMIMQTIGYRTELANQHRLEVIEYNKKSSIDELKKRVKQLDDFMRFKNIGPFTKSGTIIFEAMQGILTKHTNIMNLLKDSFSESDLTFIKYTEVLDEVLDLASNNIKSIYKRMSVFDYRANANGITTIGNQYVTEVAELTNNLVLINQKFDNLTHELVSMDTISDDSLLLELTELIDSTKMYKNN